MRKIFNRGLAILLAVAMVVPNVGMTTYATENSDVIIQEVEELPSPEVTPSAEVIESPDPIPEETAIPEETTSPEVVATPEATPTPEITPSATESPETTGSPEILPTPDESTLPEVTTTPSLGETPTPSATPSASITPTPNVTPLSRGMFTVNVYGQGTATIMGTPALGACTSGAKLSLSYGNLAVTSCTWYAANVLNEFNGNTKLGEGLSVTVKDAQIGKYIYAIYGLADDETEYATAFYGPILDPVPSLTATENSTNVGAIQSDSIDAPSVVKKNSNGALLYKYDVLTNELKSEDESDRYASTYVDLTIDAKNPIIPGSFANLSTNHTNSLEEQAYTIDDNHIRIQLDIKDAITLVKYTIYNLNGGTQDVYVLITAVDASHGVWAAASSVFDMETQMREDAISTQSIWDGIYNYSIIPYDSKYAMDSSSYATSRYEYFYLVKNGLPYTGNYTVQYSDGAEDCFGVMYNYSKLVGFSNYLKEIQIAMTSEIAENKSITIVPQVGDGEPIVITWRPSNQMLLVYTSLEDVGNVSKSVIDFDIKAGQKKTVYFAPLYSSYVLNQSSCDTLIFSGEVTDLFSSKEFHAASGDKPACIEVELDGSKIYATNTSNGYSKYLNIKADFTVSDPNIYDPHSDNPNAYLYGSFRCLGGSTNEAIMVVNSQISRTRKFYNNICNFSEIQAVVNRKTNVTFFGLNDNETIEKVVTWEAEYFGDGLVNSLYEATILPNGTSIDLKLLKSEVGLKFKAVTTEGRILQFYVSTMSAYGNLYTQNGTEITGLFKGKNLRNTDYIRQVKKENFQISFGEWIYNNSTKITSFTPIGEVNDYIDSAKLIINNQSIAEASGDALGEGADKVLWFGDGSSNSVLMNRDRTGNYVA